MRLRVLVAVSGRCGRRGHPDRHPAGPGRHHPSTPSPARWRWPGRSCRPTTGGPPPGPGTTGGSAADDAHVFVATNRAELVAALGGNNATNGTNATPKIIFVSGKFNANVNDANEPLTCADYEDPAYDLDQFLATYDPAVWGRVAPTGPLEDGPGRLDPQPARPDLHQRGVQHHDHRHQQRRRCGASTSTCRTSRT